MKQGKRGVDVVATKIAARPGPAALHWAALMNRTETILALVELGANLSGEGPCNHSSLLRFLRPFSWRALDAPRGGRNKVA